MGRNPCGKAFGRAAGVMNIFLLAIGGSCGAMARHSIGTLILKREKPTFPFGTFFINIIGSLILGIVCGLKLDGNFYLLFGDGFCGAFTTFSTFSLESVRLICGHAHRKAALYLALSAASGVMLFAAGYRIASMLRR